MLPSCYLQRSCIDYLDNLKVFLIYLYSNPFESDERYSHPDKEPDIVWSSELQQGMMQPAIKKAVDEYTQTKVPGPFRSTPIVSRFSQMRFNIYEKGLTMREHVDHIYSIFDGKEKGIPVLSFVGMLNDDYEGGEFIMNGEKLTLKAGDLLVFPSNFLFPHVVHPVTKGTRYSLVAWGY
tara:strand:- start:600 stop:1136 length:537 start_codon:yes stop_codon:yes gene_type:complete